MRLVKLYSIQHNTVIHQLRHILITLRTKMKENIDKRHPSNQSGYTDLIGAHRIENKPQIINDMITNAQCRYSAVKSLPVMFVHAMFMPSLSRQDTLHALF